MLLSTPGDRDSRRQWLRKFSLYLISRARNGSWTRLLPEAERPVFINDVLDRYQRIAADRPGEENTFKFYQMDVTLAPAEVK